MWALPGRYLLFALIILLINALVVGWAWMNKRDSYDACLIEGMKDKPPYMATEVFNACAKRTGR